MSMLPTRFLPVFSLAFVSISYLFFPKTAQAQFIQRSFINPSFEEDLIDVNGSPGFATMPLSCFIQVDQDSVPAWNTSHSFVSASGNCSGFQNPGNANLIELWSNNFNNVTSVQGDQFAELNAEENSQLFQNFCVIQGETISFSIYHRGRASATNPDVMAFTVNGQPFVEISTTSDGDPSSITALTGANAPDNGTVDISSLSATDAGNGWVLYEGEFEYTDPSGEIEIGFEAVSTGGGNLTIGNFIDSAQFSGTPIIEVAATASGLTPESEPNPVNPAQVRVVGLVESDIQVDISIIGGTAEFGVDYDFPDSVPVKTVNGNPTVTVTIPAGNYNGTADTGSLINIPVEINQDLILEGNETIEFEVLENNTFINSSATNCGSNPIQVSTYTIVDDEKDFGDAPSSYGTDTAVHIIDPTNKAQLSLGSEPPDDNEIEPKTPLDGSGDDDDGVDDEDGVISFPTLYTNAGLSYTVEVDVTNATGSDAFLAGYIDFNGDGDFDDANEQSATVTVPTSGTNPETFDVTFTPPSVMTAQDPIYARFRLSSTQSEVESPTGEANSGEVEDYSLAIIQSGAPAPTGPPFDCATFGGGIIVIGNSTGADGTRDANSQLRKVNIVDGSTTDIGSNQTDFNYNQIGFNINDNYVYGIIESTEDQANYPKGGVIRVDANGNVQVLGVPTQVGSSTYTYTDLDNAPAGTVIGGNRMVTIPRYDNRQQQVVWIIDLNTLEVTQAGLFGDSNSERINDIAFNPLDPTTDRLFAVLDSGEVINFTVSGNSTAQIPFTIEHNDALPNVGNLNMGSQWFDNGNRLYFRSNRNAGGFNQVVGYITGIDGDSGTPTTTTYLGSSGSGGSHDGASCYTLDLGKGVNPTTIAAGESVTYTYEISNPTGVSQTVIFEDTLSTVEDYGSTGDLENETPVGGTFQIGTLSIAGALNNGTATLSNNDQTLEITGLQIPQLSTATIAINVLTPADAAFPETYYNQARIPQIGGATLTQPILSDDLASGKVDDPTSIELTEPIATDPLILLAKRITAINGETTSVDGTDLDSFVDVAGDDSDNPDKNWPDPRDTYLSGGINVEVEPGDIIEYTIYFLSSGGQAARNVTICDLIPEHQTYIRDSFDSRGGGTNLGIAALIRKNPLPNPLPNPLTPNQYLTNLDGDDEGSFFDPGRTPPSECKKPGSFESLEADDNTNGLVVVDVVTNPTTLPPATSPGDPPESYGFIRFRTKVD